MTQLIDLSKLPAPTVVEPLDYTVVLKDMLATLREFDPTFDAFVESDPALKVLEVAAYREVHLRARINEAAKAVMLAYSSGEDLDNLVALFNVERKVLVEADTSKSPPVEVVMESDTELRRRFLLALFTLSTAGAANSYKFHALSVKGVKDASATTPEGAPGVVVVSLLPASEESEAEELAKLVKEVEAVLSLEDVRPLTDVVRVQIADYVDFEVRATIHCYSGPDTEVVRTAARAALDKYISDNHRVGYDITLSGLYAALHQPGVERVVLELPKGDIEVEETEVSRCTDITLSYPQAASNTANTGGSDEGQDGGSV